MVLCKFFQQGSCRFGTKCQNEHFDIKQLLKADIESALNGKQWPFSSFGPFKDKPCIPNFITDQSFEEMRLLCYEARQKNYFEQFHQQFSREAMEVKNKMKALLELSPEVIDLVTNIYDSDGVGGGAAVNKNNNPFGLGNGNAANSAAGSLFAKPTPTGGGGNVFGGGGGFNASAGGGASLFGGGNTAQQNSIFAQQAAKPTNPIFGGGAPAAQNQTNPLFGQQQQMNANAMGGSGGGLFAQAAQQSAPLFGQQQNAGLFRQAMQQPQQPQQASGNIFAQAVQQQQQSQNIFAQAAAQQQMPQISQQQQQQQPAGTNIFAQAAQQMQPQQAGLFQQAMQQTPQVHPNNSQQMQLQPQQQQQQAQQLPPNQSGVYSRMEDLTAEDIEAFKADAFMPGKIPFSPPPREMIN